MLCFAREGGGSTLIRSTADVEQLLPFIYHFRISLRAQSYLAGGRGGGSPRSPELPGCVLNSAIYLLATLSNCP